MTRAARPDGRLLPWGLSALAFVLAFWQRPFAASTDTRIELGADPSLFLERVAHMWSPTWDLGHVQASQFAGYLFPMAPFFALADALGVPPVVAQRLWIGLLLALAAWGVVRLLDRLWDERRGVAHLVAGALYLGSPYVVIVMNRGSAWLLAYAALPWLLVLAHEGVRRPAGWRAPAAAGLIVAAAGGGINAAVLFWVLAGPVALLAWEWLAGRRELRAVAGYAWRWALCALLVSLWWLVPLALAGRYGTDYLSYSERPESILATPSASESLRLLGYWVAYFGTGFDGSEPVVPAIGSYIFQPLVIAGSLAIPLAALAGLRWTRRWSYAGFFAMLLAGGVLVMAAGFPEGTLLHGVLTDAYYEAGPLQVLRTTYKAAPLVAVALAVLAGVAAALLVAHAREQGLRLLGTRVPVWALGVLAVPVMLWGAPLWRGTAIDSQVSYDAVPAAWRAAVADAQTATPPNTRIAVLPGEVFGWYTWGGTWDPIAPAISRRPVVERTLLPWADPRSSELLVAVDDLVQQGRLTPGQLPPLLRLMGVGRTLVGSDTRRLRSGALDAARAAEVLEAQPGFERPAARYGPEEDRVPQDGRGGPVRRLPQVRAYDAPRPASPGIVRAHRTDAPVVLEGDARGITSLAAVGGLDPERALFYAADTGAAALGARLREGAELVFTDANRRRGRLPARLTENLGPVVPAGERLDRQWPEYEPFPGSGTERQTVAVYSGLRMLRAPDPPSFAAFPANRPFAALDGRLDTAWLATAQDPDERYLELALARPRAVREILLHPHADAAGTTSAVDVSVNGGPPRRVRLTGGWNRIPIDVASLRTLRIDVAAVRNASLFAGLGGIDELRIPGLQVREALRLPTALAGATRGRDLARSPISVVLERLTAEFPGRSGALTGAAQSQDPLDAVDPEPALRRIVTLPAARRFTVGGWARALPDASPVALDRLTGVPAPWRFVSTAVFEGVPAHRASSAFDGDPRTAWIGERVPRSTPWLSWRGPSELTISAFRIVPLAGPYRRPTAVRVFTTQGPVRARVGPRGDVRLPAPIRANGLRIEIAASAPPSAGADRRLRGVAIAELEVPGLRPPAPRRRGPLRSACGALTVAADVADADVRVTGRIESLDTGAPLPLAGCGRRDTLSMRAGTSTVTAAPGAAFATDHLLLRSPAPAAAPAPAPSPVVSAVRAGQGGPQSANLRAAAPAWLVLGESWSSGWRAWCRDAGGDERSLGRSIPIDGFANGWRVDVGCASVRFAFAPQRLATAAQIASLLAALVLVLLLARGRRRGRGPVREMTLAVPVLSPSPASLRRASWPAAIALGVALGGITGAAAAWRAGLGLAVLVVVLAREGLSAARLYATAAVLVALVPVLYLVDPVEDRTGFDFGFAQRHLEAHWMAFAAMLCVLLGAALDAYDRRAASGAPPAEATTTAPARNSSAS